MQLGDGKEAKRASIPKDVGELTLDWAVKLLSLPRTVGEHPEDGKPIMASIGRYGPYLAHDGKYARLRATAEVFDTGMNAAVVMLAEALANKGSREGRAKAEALKSFGLHPTSGGEIKLMPGRYGNYLTDGTTNATLPKDADVETLTAEQAIVLIDEKAAKGPAKGTGRKKAPAKKAPAKKAAAKKPAAKKPAAKKAPAKKAKPTAEAAE